MKKEAGSLLIVILIIVMVVVLLLIGWFVVFKKKLPNFKQTNAPQVSKVDNAVDLSSPPSDEKFIPDFVSHCNNTPNHYWSGSACLSK